MSTISGITLLSKFKIQNVIGMGVDEGNEIAFVAIQDRAY
ncbi:hypothetical protein V6Z12_A10G241800 [Gossypium hirsutum]